MYRLLFVVVVLLFWRDSRDDMLGFGFLYIEKYTTVTTATATTKELTPIKIADSTFLFTVVSSISVRFFFIAGTKVVFCSPY